MTDTVSEAITKINQLAAESLGRIFGMNDDEKLRVILTEMQADLVHTVQACLVAAGADPDIDEMEKQVCAAGTKPSHFIRQQFEQAQKK